MPKLTKQKLTKQKKDELLKILNLPDITITVCDYKAYNNGVSDKYYRVHTESLTTSLMDFVITPVCRGIAQYEIITGNEKFSHLIRTNAVFHTRGANDILEIYSMLQIRYLAQQTRANQK